MTDSRATPVWLQCNRNIKWYSHCLSYTFYNRDGLPPMSMSIYIAHYRTVPLMHSMHQILLKQVRFQ